MAKRTISVEILGDYSSLQKTFSGASRSAKGFERDLGKSARGAVAASVSFRGLGRSIAFASSYFLGGAGIVYALRKGVEGAESLEKAQRSLGVVVQRNGGNFKQQLPAIEQWAAAQQRFGISNVQAEQGLARATVITGSAAQGMRAYTEALEISKATGKSFTAVLLAASKANEGQTTALARYIGKIPKGTSALQLFNLVQGKYAGQAAANTMATDKLGAALTNIETLVGTALLPTINKYSSELGKWLSQSQNQERVQRDVSSAVKVLSDVLSTARGVIGGVDKATGGFKHTLELLVGLKVASFVAGWAGSFVRLAQAEKAVNEAAVVTRIRQYTEGVAAAGTAAEASATKANALRASLSRLAAIGVITIGIEILLNKKSIDKKVTGFLRGHDLGFLTGGQLKLPKGATAADVAGMIAKAQKAGAPGFEVDVLKKVQAQLAAKEAKAEKLGATRGLGPHHSETVIGRSASHVAGATRGPKQLSLQGRLNLAELSLAEASATKGVKDDLAALRKKAAVLQAMIAKGGTLAQQTQRNQDLASVLDQINSIEAAGTKDTTQKRKKQLDLIKKDAAAEKKAADARKQALQQALDTAKGVIGDLGQGPVATGQFAQTLQSFGGKLDAGMFTQDLAAQNNQTAGFLKNLHKLSNRGAPPGLVQSLLQQGQGGMDEASALAGASRKQLGVFLADYRKRQKLLTQVARMEVSTPTVNVRANNVTVGKTDAHDRPGDRFQTKASKGRRR